MARSQFHIHYIVSMLIARHRSLHVGLPVEVHACDVLQSRLNLDCYK